MSLLMTMLSSFFRDRTSMAHSLAVLTADRTFSNPPKIKGFQGDVKQIAGPTG
jgi:hypothetical protein